MPQFIFNSTTEGLKTTTINIPTTGGMLIQGTLTVPSARRIGEPGPGGGTGPNLGPLAVPSQSFGSLALGTASNFAMLAATAITGSTGAGSTVTGDIGIYPTAISAITNFPPSTVTGGVIRGPTAISQQGIADALTAYTAARALTATPIAAVLDGQTLTPGVYTEASSTFSLAGSADGTLTFNGPGTYIINAASTITTGAGGIPTMAFTGGATTANTFIYWTAGSSATINVGVTAAGAIFRGTIIANASITVTQAGTVNGSMWALTGAATLSATNAANGVATLSSAPINPNSPSRIITTVNQNGSPIYVSNPGDMGFLLRNVDCTANDVITVVLTSDLDSDKQSNTVRLTVAVAQAN